MDYLIDFNNKCSLNELEKQGEIKYKSNIMSIVVLSSNKSISEIQNIRGVVSVREERNRILF